jgi:heavy metal translocating P-type ATPase
MIRGKTSLALQLTAAMLAAGLLVIATICRVAFPEDRFLSDLVAGGAALLVALPILAAAWQSLRDPDLHGLSDLLVALALIAAWATGDLMTAAILPIVMIAGHVLEERSLLGSQEAIRVLARLVQDQSRRVLPGGAVETVPTGALAAGDLIELRAGDRLAVDGVVVSGMSSLDTASLTGESVPRDVAPGDAVMAGAIALDGLLVVRATRVGRETTLGKIIALMESAERAKPPVTRLLERYAGQYLGLILMVAAAAWLMTGSTEAMLAVLVASCPCALVLAAPATAVAAIAVAARHGILIKGSAFLEQLAEVGSLILDKTGTLTRGELALVGTLPDAGCDAAEIRRIGALLGAASTHPVSRALARLVPDEVPEGLAEVQEHSGLGVTARLPDGRGAALGRLALFQTLGIAASPPPPHDGPVAGVACDGKFLGWLTLADEIRPEAKAALRDLRGLGLSRQTLLTGDRLSVAQRVAGQLGIDRVEAEALPERKMRQVLQAVRAGQRPLVVGDGINDSLALKAGAVGIAMGANGTDVALASADLVLMTSDLGRIGTAIRLSRRCRRTIHVNVAMGLGWTTLLVAAAACGLLGSQGAILAALLHNVGTFAGMANAGRLLLFSEHDHGAGPALPLPGANERVPALAAAE